MYITLWIHFHLSLGRSCGLPGYFPMGWIIGRSYLYGDQVKYKCHPGYRLIGNTTRECQADGTWSGVTPSCQGKISMQDLKVYLFVHSLLPLYLSYTSLLLLLCRCICEQKHVWHTQTHTHISTNNTQGSTDKIHFLRYICSLTKTKPKY